MLTSWSPSWRISPEKSASVWMGRRGLLKTHLPEPDLDEAASGRAAYSATASDRAACPAALAAAFFAGFAGAFFAVFLAAVFCVAAFLAPAGCAFAVSPRLSAQRRCEASEMARLPAALIFRLGFGGAGLAADPGVLDSAFIAAHRFFWPSAIRRRAAALTFRFRLGASAATVPSVLPPDNMARSSPIWVSIRLFCDSKPSMAAAMISAFSFGVGM